VERPSLEDVFVGLTGEGFDVSGWSRLGPWAGRRAAELPAPGPRKIPRLRGADGVPSAPQSGNSGGPWRRPGPDRRRSQGRRSPRTWRLDLRRHHPQRPVRCARRVPGGDAAVPAVGR